MAWFACWGDCGFPGCDVFSPAACNFCTSCSNKVLTFRRVSTRSWSRMDALPAWEPVSAACDGVSEVGVDWAEEAAGKAVTVIEEMLGLGVLLET